MIRFNNIDEIEKYVDHIFTGDYTGRKYTLKKVNDDYFWIFAGRKYWQIVFGKDEVLSFFDKKEHMKRDRINWNLQSNKIFK